MRPVLTLVPLLLAVLMTSFRGLTETMARFGVDYEASHGRLPLPAWTAGAITDHIVHHLHPYIPLNHTPAAYRQMRPILKQRGCEIEM